MRRDRRRDGSELSAASFRRKARFFSVPVRRGTAPPGAVLLRRRARLHQAVQHGADRIRQAARGVRKVMANAEELLVKHHAEEEAA